MTIDAIHIDELDKKTLFDLLAAVSVPLPLRCAVCGDETWDLEVRYPMFYRYSKHAPYTWADIILVCRQCGHTLAFDPRRLGVIFD